MTENLAAQESRFLRRDIPRWMRFLKRLAQMNLVPDHPIKCMAGHAR